MKTVKDLVQHLNKYEDAVIIVGPGALANQDKNDYSIEEFNDNYNRKALVREPNKMWDFFNKNMKKDISEETLNTYRAIKAFDDVTALIIDQNTNSPMMSKKADLHGSIHNFKCNKCKISYTTNYVYGAEEGHEEYEEGRIVECEVCGGAIRPTALLSGERYDNVMFLDIQEKIKASHTLILVGMDYTEEALMQLIAEYGDVKSFINSQETGEEKMLVSIQTNEEEFDPNEMTFFEFIVKGDITDALLRLKSAF